MTPTTGISAAASARPQKAWPHQAIASGLQSFQNGDSATVSTGAYSISQGFGDTFTRFKWNLFGNEGGGPAMALIPYAKWPTAPMVPQGVGNGYIEGGLIAPFAMPLPGGFTAILMGEMDIVKNSFDGNYRVNIPALLNISRPIFENVTAYAEIFTNWSTNPQAPNIVTADFAVAWQPRPNFQLDAGINIGLNYAAIPYRVGPVARCQILFGARQQILRLSRRDESAASGGPANGERPRWN